MGGLALKAMSIKWTKAGELLAKTTFLMVICWSLVPALYWQISSKYAAILIALSFLGIIIEQKLSTRNLLRLATSYLAAIMLTFYIWYFVRRAYPSPLLYVANGIIVWYPVVFSRYLLIKNDAVYNKKVLFFVIVCLLITGVTTIAGQLWYPMAARLLAGGGVRSELEVYSRMNIGGYSYVYGAVLSAPYLMLILFNRVDRRRKLLQLLSGLAFVSVACAVYLSQYYIAIALLLASILLYIICLLVIKYINLEIVIESKLRRSLFSMIVGLLLAISSVASVIVLSSSPVKTLMRNLGQSMLIERSNLFEVAHQLNAQSDEIILIGEETALAALDIKQRHGSPDASVSARIEQEMNSLTTENQPSAQSNNKSSGSMEGSPETQVGNDSSSPLESSMEAQPELNNEHDNPDLTSNVALKTRIEVYMRPFSTFLKVHGLATC